MKVIKQFLPNPGNGAYALALLIIGGCWCIPVGAASTDAATVSPRPSANLHIGISEQARITEHANAYDAEVGNLRLRKPGAAWRLVSASLIKDGFATMFTFAGPLPNDLFAVYAMERAVEGTDKEVAEAVAAQFSQSGASLERKGHRTISGIDGTELILRPVGAGASQRILVWIGRRNGYGYLTLATVNDTGSEELDRAHTLFDLVSVSDPARLAKPSATTFAPRYESARYRYTVQGVPKGWVGYRYQGTELPQVDYYASNTFLNASAFIVAVDLQGTDPSTDALAQVLLGAISYRPMSNPQRTSIQRDGLAGLQFDFDGQDTRERRHVRAQILKGVDRAYLLATAFPVASDQASGDAEAFLRQVDFSKEATPKRDLGSYDARERETQYNFFKGLGAQYFGKKQYQSALEYYRLALALHPEEAGALVSVMASQNFLGRYADGLALAESNADRFAREYDVVAYRAYFLQRLGRRDEALKYYRNAFALGTRDDEDFSVYINLVWDSGQREQALREAKEYAATSDTPKIKRLVGQLHFKAENFDLAVQAYKTVYSQNPQDLQAAYGLIESYYRLNRQHDVIAVIEGLQRDGHDAADIYFLQGRSEYALGWYQRAKQSFEKVLSMNPVDATAKAYLDHVSSQLGQGDNSAVKTELKAVPLPEAVLKEDLKAGPPVTHDDAVYLLRGRAYEFQRGVGMRYTHYMKVKLNSRQGVDAFSTLHFRFDPIKEQIYVNSLVVRNAEGEVVANGDVSQYYVLDDTSNGMATYDKVLNIPVAGIAPGYTIEAAVTYRSLDKAERFRFLTLPMFADYPAQRAVVSISGDIKGLRWRMPPTSRKVGSGNTLAWQLVGVSAYRDEVAQDDPRTFMPFGWLSDGGTTWAGLGQSYLDDLKDRMTLDETLRRQAVELTRDAKQPLEKARILAKYVQSALTYKAIEFGKRGVIPNRTDEILRNRYGDCKDHALVLQQMLSAVGVEARLALVNSSGRVDEEFPSLDQFDHMIVACPGCGNGVFLDATEKNMEVLGPIPGGQGRALALILDGASSRLESIPPYRSEDASVVADGTVKVEPDGVVQVRQQVSFSGYSAAYMRGQLLKADPAKRLETVQGLMRTADPGAVVQRVDVANIQDVAQPLVLNLEYTAGTQFLTAEGRMLGKLPAVWERFWLHFEPSPKRETPFAIRYPWHIISTLQVQGVDDATLKGLAAVAEKRGDGRYVKWRSNRSGVDRNMVVRFDAQLLPGHYPAREYDSLRQEAELGLGSVMEPVALRLPVHQ